MSQGTRTFVDGAFLWRMHAQEGFPLELSLPILAGRGQLPTWEPLMRAAIADGMRPERIAARLDAIVGEMFPPAEAGLVRQRLSLLAARVAATPPESPESAPDAH